MIPKIVYQTWFSKNNIPDTYVQIINHNKNLNPEYDFIIYDDQDLHNLFQNAPISIKNAYLRINPHYGPARSDLFRYYIIYVKGGIYLDIKIKCLRPFREFIEENTECLLSYWEGLYYNQDILSNQKGELQNWHIIFQPKSLLLEKVLSTIIATIHDLSDHDVQEIRGKYGVLKSTGPLIYTQIIEKMIQSGSSVVDFFNSNYYLEYGSTYIGLQYGAYIHYSSLNEPVFLNKNLSIPMKFFINHRFIHTPGIYLLHSYKFIKKLDILLRGCNIVFCKKNNDIYFLAFDNDAKKIITHFLRFAYNIHNQENIFFYNDLCVKQAYLNENNEIIFHFQVFIK